jgi:hypothetical protein
MFIYEYNNYDPNIFEYNVMRITIWDQISKLNIHEVLALKISVYDPRYTMPSQAVLNIKLNRPPSGGNL